MRTRTLFFGACLLSCLSAPASTVAAQTPPVLPSREYSGIYISTPEEDYFTSCGIESSDEAWSLRFRDDEPRAPFLKKVTAMRGLPPLTHFIRVRGTLGPPGRYNVGFQTRELAVDTLLAVSESLETCAGFGAPPAWSRISAKFSNLKGVSLSNNGRLAALLDIDGRISLWSTETGQIVRRLGSVAKGSVNAASYGPMVFSDDGSLLAVGGNEGVVRVWRTRDGKRLFSLALKDSAAVAKEMAKIPPRADAPGWKPPPPSNFYTPARQIVFNKRGTMLATTNLFSTIVWSLKSGKKLAEFRVGNDPRRKVFFVGDEGLLMTADSARVTVRSYLDAPPVKRPGVDATQTDHVVMSPDRRMM
ncbi:MAG TPA: hypothetical protein VIG78_07750, partial [Gemmatimonadaceae bacterium]